MKFFDDLIEIQALSIEQLDFLINFFKKYSLNSIANVSIFEKTCKRENINYELAKKFYNVLSFIVDGFIEEKSIEKGINVIESDYIDSNHEEVKQLWNYLKSKITDLNEFILKRKEHYLSQLSNSIESFNLVCNIRPIYDIKRENIIGLSYPITLSILPDSSNEKITFELKEDDLLKLQMEVNMAVQKLNILKQNFHL